MRITSGNKGEWSELYALVKLLSVGKLYAADDNVNLISDQYFPILKIFREEVDGQPLVYAIDKTDGSVSIHLHGSLINSIQSIDLISMATDLYQGIVSGNANSFCIPCAPHIMAALSCNRLAAPSSDKTDIQLQLHDINTGFEPICGFSIKSELGSAPTLLNASGATNFVFHANSLNPHLVDVINHISTRNKIIDRVNTIIQNSSLEYSGLANSTFSNNLLLIDSSMESILSYMLKDYYQGNTSKCRDLVSRIEVANPLHFPRSGLYEYKMKKFLSSVALGMTPSHEWDGRDEANGGYVIVKRDGNVVAYHLYNRNSFEQYLLNNTKLEKGSSSRHHFGELYFDEHGNTCINLNLQIRFI